MESHVVSLRTAPELQQEGTTCGRVQAGSPGGRFLRCYKRETEGA